MSSVTRVISADLELKSGNENQELHWCKTVQKIKFLGNFWIGSPYFKWHFIETDSF